MPIALAAAPHSSLSFFSTTITTAATMTPPAAAAADHPTLPVGNHAAVVVPDEAVRQYLNRLCQLT